MAEEDKYRSAANYVELDRKHRKRSKWSTVLVIAIVVLAASLVALGVIWFSYLQGQQKYDGIARHADIEEVGDSLDGLSVDWDALHEVNPDVVAWLYLPGTAINYPVVRGEDNEYYLTHDFDGAQGWLTNFGSIFMDFRNSPDWSDSAYFIYGHHMNDGSMFADLAGLQDQERFDAARTVYLLSPLGNFKLRTFTLLHCAADDPLVQTMFASRDEQVDYVQDKIDRSVVDPGTIPSARAITKTFAFATCDNVGGGRYVLYAYVEDTTAEGLSGTVGVAASDAQPIGLVDDLKQD